MQKKYVRVLSILMVLSSFSLYGQKDYLDKIKNHLEKKQSTYRLNSKDYADLVIYDQYYTESLAVEHVYTVQRINNIPIFNSVGNFAFKHGEIAYFANSFQLNIKNRINTKKPQLSATEAVTSAARALGLQVLKKPKVLSKKNRREFLFSESGISRHEIPAKLVYQPTEKNELRLAWNISIHTLDGKHWWSIRVDAITGEILDKNDWIVHCVFPENPFAKTAYRKTRSTTKTSEKSTFSTLGDGAQYKVFPFPIESPNFGNRSIVTAPADAAASPYGWHDTNGAAGPEYTTTRGNNVHAAEDRNGDDIPGYSPDGGTLLNFVFPLDLNQDPSGYIDAAVTNLFYVNNMMHDIWYQYGFDEGAGNFQQTNYSINGKDTDYVIALAQQGADNGPGDNANFATPPDGENPYMRMFTWSSSAIPQLLTITSPTTLAGTYIGTPAAFGPSIPGDGITADFVLLTDDNSGGTSADPNDGCDVIINATELNGKIAIIRRGDCDFYAKVLKAQNAGAIAAIIVNDEVGLITMGGEGTAVTIPSIMIKKDQGEAIITALSAGETVHGTIKNKGPYEKDGDFDNGIIAHEYGHGISNRLTGGPLRADCLINDEQMGEGWSDFFALVLTMNAGDKATDPRGIATYVANQDMTGTGIRQYHYSTDRSINPFTYADVANQDYTDVDGNLVVNAHGVGSIWATMLWDMTWALIDKYGYDPDLYHGTGGNNIAMQLVIDGLKLQPCGPGFVDGRDAILAADSLYNNGANKKLIWKAFAERGLGYSANQGSSFSINDQTEAFDMPPSMATESFEVNTFKIYPNPTTDGIVTISLPEINGEVQINLYDINGRKVLSKKIETTRETSIDVSPLSAGIYILQLSSKEKIQTKKLIIQ